MLPDEMSKKIHIVIAKLKKKKVSLQTPKSFLIWMRALLKNTAGYFI